MPWDCLIFDNNYMEMKLVKQIYKLSGESGLLVLENSRNKRVHIIRTTDALGSLSRVLRATKSRNKRWKLLRKDVKKLDIKLVSEDGSRMSYQRWVDHYEGLGYTLYSKYKAIEYKVKIEVLPQLPPQLGFDSVVKLVTRNKSEIEVGRFSTLQEAQTWVDGEYPGGRVREVKYRRI